MGALLSRQTIPLQVGAILAGFSWFLDREAGPEVSLLKNVDSTFNLHEEAEDSVVLFGRVAVEQDFQRPVAVNLNLKKLHTPQRVRLHTILRILHHRYPLSQFLIQNRLRQLLCLHFADAFDALLEMCIQLYQVVYALPSI